MKKLLTIWLVVSLVTLFTQFAYSESGLVQISNHVYSYVDVKDGSPAFSYGANAGIIIGKNSILVVDTLVSAKEGNRLLSDIRAVSDKPIRYVVNSHYHLDHTFGNAVFAGLGTDIISHVNCAEAMKKSAVDTLANANAYGLTPEDMEGTKLAYPNITFTDKVGLYLGGLQVDLIYISPSHSKGSIIVQVPAEGVVFAGDSLFTDFHPYMADGDIANWQEALDSIIALNADKIVPGHGPLSTNKDLVDMKAYIAAFDKKANDLTAESNEVGYIVAELKKFMPARSRGEGLIQANIQGKYLKVENK